MAIIIWLPNAFHDTNGYSSRSSETQAQTHNDDHKIKYAHTLTLRNFIVKIYKTTRVRNNWQLILPAKEHFMIKKRQQTENAERERLREKLIQTK